MINKYLDWLAEHPSYSDNTKETYGSLVASPLFRGFFDLLLEAPEKAEAVIREKSMSTRQQYFKVARKILEMNGEAVPEVGATSFRIVSPEPLYTEDERGQISSWDDFIHFAERVENDEWKLIFQVAAYTGARPGELYALKPQNVRNERITICHNYCFKTGSYSVPKNGKTRIVPLLGVLRRLLVPRMEEEWLLPRPKACTQGHHATILSRYCQRHGYGPIQFRRIRALFAKKLRTEGVSMTTVMDICGWADYQTADRYNKEAGVDIQAAAKALDGALGDRRE